ncbi:MAG: hypothetical protein ACM3X5_03295 [Bacillota bacterium]
MADVTGSQSGRFRRPPDLWLYALDGARSEKDLVMVVREFLATWTPHDLQRLPASCRPPRLVDSDDVGAYAVELSQYRFDALTDPEDRRLLERMKSFFAHATSRAAIIRGAGLTLAAGQ